MADGEQCAGLERAAQRKEWWLGAELNRRHKDFQSSALPTELPSQTIEKPLFGLCLARVYDRDGKRVRGLWLRNGIYYAQVRVGSHKARVRFEHASTVPQAVTELQALKRRRWATPTALNERRSEAVRATPPPNGRRISSAENFVSFMDPPFPIGHSPCRSNEYIKLALHVVRCQFVSSNGAAPRT
jgi:hypothetical protein